MSSFLRTFPFGGAFFIIKLAIILTFLNGTKTQSQSPNPQISTSVGKYICDQQKVHQETGEIQSPLQARPENDDSKCGWYIWSKCDLNSESESCPSFNLEMCSEAENPEAKKKGKGIATSKQQKQLPDPCQNSTVQGLPDPEIVSSMSKYPSVVTIEKGDICQVKFGTGLILDKNWVIVQEYYQEFSEKHPDFFVIVAGERRMHVDEGTEQRRNVAAYIPHPDLGVKKLQYYKNDIGLVRVSTPFEFNENVQPIDLAAIEKLVPSIAKSSLKIVGWIQAQPMKEEEELLASLMESSLDFASFDDCFDSEMEGGEAPVDWLICAGKCLVSGDEKNRPIPSILFAQGNSDLDSKSESESVSIPVGLGPLKFKGGRPQYGAFLNLASFIPWIKETVEGQSQGQSEGQTTESPESESESRIVRGEDAPPYKYKSMVNLEEYASYACTAHGCGGLILSEDWVMTAAHCLFTGPPPSPESRRVIVSDHDISENNENEQIRAVSKIIIHEDYDEETSYNDIALLKVTPPFTFNERVQKVTLPEPSFEPTAGGDSGGPVFFISESGEQIVLGLTSYVSLTSVGGGKGEPTDRSNDALDSKNGLVGSKEKMPGIFTKVSYFIEWIQKNTDMPTK